MILRQTCSAIRASGHVQSQPEALGAEQVCLKPFIALYVCIQYHYCQNQNSTKACHFLPHEQQLKQREARDQTYVAVE